METLGHHPYLVLRDGQFWTCPELGITTRSEADMHTAITQITTDGFTSVPLVHLERNP